MCAAYTLTDTLRGAADSLSSAAYRGTDAVVTARARFRTSATSDIVAQGLKAVTLGARDHHVRASAVIVGADGERIQRVAAGVRGVRAVTSVRRDGALAFGHETGVTAVDPATIGRLYRHEITAGSLAGLGRHGALITYRFASKHHLRVGDRLSALDPLALGPITISNQAFDGAFDMRRDRLMLVDGPVAAVRRALTAFPDAKVQTKAAFVDQQAAWIGISRRQVRRMVRHESVITAVVGALLGIGAGLALAGGLTAWLSRYGLGFQVPVGSLLAVAIVAGLAGVVAAAMPARRASRVSVLGALAYE